MVKIDISNLSEDDKAELLHALIMDYQPIKPDPLNTYSIIKMRVTKQHCIDELKKGKYIDYFFGIKIGMNFIEKEPDCYLYDRDTTGPKATIILNKLFPKKN